MTQQEKLAIVIAAKEREMQDIGKLYKSGEISLWTRDGLQEVVKYELSALTTQMLKLASLR